MTDNFEKMILKTIEIAGVDLISILSRVISEV